MDNFESTVNVPANDGVVPESQSPLQRDFRLGLDLRIATEEPDASPLVDAFMAQYQELEELRTLESTPLAVTHANREWPGNLRHAHSQKQLTRWPSLSRWNWMTQWESEFTQSSKLAVWHQFAPVDKIRTGGDCPSLITVLPAHTKQPTRGHVRRNSAFIVPSYEDATSLHTLFRINPERVHRVTPVVRPFLFNLPVNREPNDGWFLFLVGKKRDVPRVEKWIQILAGRYPKMARKLIALETDTVSLAEENWLKILQRTKVCFYFSQSRYDWAVPAFEAMYARVPTVFLDECNAISELLPKFPLSLPRFLVDTPEPQALQEHADEAFSLLRDAGVFEPGLYARTTAEIYRRLSSRATPGHA